MSKLTDLLRQVELKDPQLAADLEREYKALSSRRAFGLNFERHHPETTEIPGRKVRKGEKVRILPPRRCLDSGDKALWVVERIERVDGGRVAHVIQLDAEDAETRIVNVDDLVVVAVFRDFIYPGLIETGRVDGTQTKSAHTVINGENYHALQALTYTHRGKIDAIYIDPPYNTGAKDWKYNNDYVGGDDSYRHSKWLSFMERRLQIARELLNPIDSVLIATIDEKEVNRLGLLLEQVFPEARIQMVSSIINPKGSSRRNEFARSDEYIYFVMIGACRVDPDGRSMTFREGKKDASKVRWAGLMRQGANGRRVARPNLFYPIFVDNKTHLVHSIGDSLPRDMSRSEVIPPEGTTAIWPLASDGRESTWGRDPSGLRAIHALGYLKRGRFTPGVEKCGFQHLQSGPIAAIEAGEIEVVGRDDDGSVIVRHAGDRTNTMPGTAWHQPSHSASEYGSTLLGKMLDGRRFPFPKSLYAVEDALRFFLNRKPDAVVLDYFAGSGTTAHAVMRLNRQDGGSRQCISITNNEVSAEEQKGLRLAGLRPGDPEWEYWGICDYITTPRIRAAITGETPNGEQIKGEYKFIDEFAVSLGMEENARFFALTYETRTEVAHHKAFRQIAPLLWLRAGAVGESIETEPEDGWALTEAYGVLVDLDASTAFVEAVEAADSIGVAYIVTDDERRFQAVARRLPGEVEAVRLYESYLRNFQIRNGG